MPVCFRKKVRCIKYPRAPRTFVPPLLRTALSLYLSYFCFSETPNPGPRSSKLETSRNLTKKEKERRGVRKEKKENCPIGTHVVMDLVDGKNGKRAVFFGVSFPIYLRWDYLLEGKVRNRYKDTLGTVGTVSL